MLRKSVFDNKVHGADSEIRAGSGNYPSIDDVSLKLQIQTG
jgi:hypothetical protein